MKNKNLEEVLKIGCKDLITDYVTLTNELRNFILYHMNRDKDYRILPLSARELFNRIFNEER